MIPSTAVARCCFLTLLLLSSTVADGNDNDDTQQIVRDKVTVKITNALSDNKVLTIHCKSKDDDLGYHDLHYSESFKFRFRPNFWGTTLFFCSFKWPGSFHYFDIYIYKRDRWQCKKECFWNIKDQGPCLEHSVYCFKWNKDVCKDQLGD